MKVTVFGTGYVGLVQGAILADAGHQVVCVDIDEKKLENLRNGIIPIYEPGLDSIVKNTVAEDRLSFTSDAKAAIAHGEIQFIAVGTPPNEDGSADLKHVLAVAKTIATHMTGYCVVVDKSTVPVGTAEKVEATIAQTLKERGVNFEFDVVSNPEFLKEGAAVADCQRPDRIVIGTDSARAEKILRELYEPFNRNHDRIITMSVKSAELTKYAANCMLATKISFMNEIANLAEKLGADIESVRQGIGSDQRIGYHFIYPGAGYGGSCFPKDIRALIHTGTQQKMEMKMAIAAQQVNEFSQDRFARRICDYFKDKNRSITLAVWGLAFKAKTDDVRESPAINCVKKLLDKGMKIRAYDPEAAATARAAMGDKIEIVENGYDALTDADALVILTEWQEFRNPDFELIVKKLKKPIVFDGRNLYDLEVVRKAGIEYHSIGRPDVG